MLGVICFDRFLCTPQRLSFVTYATALESSHWILFLHGGERPDALKRLVLLIRAACSLLHRLSFCDFSLWKIPTGTERIPPPPPLDRSTSLSPWGTMNIKSLKCFTNTVSQLLCLGFYGSLDHSFCVEGVFWALFHIVEVLCPFLFTINWSCAGL